MLYKQSTQVPNFLFDNYLGELTEAELKIVLLVVRQTFGWYNEKTKERKKRDRISVSQFQKKTKLSKRIISTATQSLVHRQLLQITDYQGKPLLLPKERKGKTRLFFSLIIPVHLLHCTSAKNVAGPVQNCYHNKTNYTKLNEAKLNPRFSGHISEAMTQNKIFTAVMKR